MTIPTTSPTFNVTVRSRMSRITIFFFIVVFAATAIAAPMPSTGTVEVFFSPHGGATEAIVSEIRGSRQEVLVQAYSFTSKPIAKALLDARKRGVRVEAVLDKSNATAKYSAATFLANAGISVLIDSDHAIAHNKIMIIDRSTLITGSFNFTSGAEKNAENLLVLKGNKPLLDKYLQNFEEHKAHSTPYSR